MKHRCHYCGRPFDGGPKRRYCSRMCCARGISRARAHFRTSQEQRAAGIIVGAVEDRKRREKRLTRIDWLGRMNDLRVEYKGARNWRGLQRLAAKYAAGDKALHIPPMPREAARVRAEAGQ